MKLLGFQRDAVDSLVQFARQYVQQSTAFPEARARAANTAWSMAPPAAALGKDYSETLSSTKSSIPNAAIVIPTGGGKTITGACAGIEVARALGHVGIFLVWMVPSDAIYDQTRIAFGEGGWLRTVIKEQYGLETNLKTKNSVWSDNDFRPDTLTVLLVIMQSLVGDANRLRFYRSADLVAGLEIWAGKDVEPSLAALLNVTRPVFIVDEAHKAYSRSGREFFKGGDYASFVVELTATPKGYSGQEYPNIAYAASAAQLIEESLLKNPLEYHLKSTSTVEELLAACIDKRDRLEKDLQEEAYFTPPKVLVSGSRTAEEHSAYPTSAQSLCQQLIDLGVPAQQIAIKSATTNQIAGLDMDSREVQIRYVITSKALAEGWDVKSVFIVALLNEIGAPLTTFQLIGRGMRQPNREYFRQGDLNRLHVFTNSITQDEAVAQLRNFLDSEGLTGLWVDGFDPAVFHEIPLPPSVLVPGVQIVATDVYRRLWLQKARASRIKALPLSDVLFGVPLDSSVTTLDLAKQRGPALVTSSATVGRNDPATAWHRDFLLGGQLALSSHFSDSTESASYLSALYKEWAADSAFDRLCSVPPAMAVRKVLRHVHDQLERLKKDVFFSDVLPGATFPLQEYPNRTAIPMAYKTPDPLGTQPFMHSVFGDFPKSLLNPDELAFARFLDSRKVPWFRNPSQRGWYALPLLDGHMYPDFGLLLQPQGGGPETFQRVVLIETKGAHLVDNEDSKRKRRVCSDVTALSGGSVTALFGTFNEMRISVSELLGEENG
jgi:superfamily II DNA or RNA helicase